MGLTNKARRYIEKNHKKQSAKQIAGKLNLSAGEVQQYIDTLKEDSPAATGSIDSLSRSKKVGFTLIALLIPVLFFMILEGGLRYVDYKGDQSLFQEVEMRGETYKMPNKNFASRYFSYISTIPTPSEDLFKAEKPENGYRIFVLGGSTTAGYPYGFNGMFSRVVEDVLRDALPEAEVEVVNLGISAVNSYTIYDQMDEILAEDPDAILFYGGHNEYYGALGVGSSENFGEYPSFVRAILFLQRFKTFLWLRDAYAYLASNVGEWLNSNNQNQARPSTLMERMVGNRSIPLHSQKYKAGLRQFESNLEKILNRFSKAEVPVLVGSLASNIKDQPPFISVKTDTLPAARHIYERARDSLVSGNTGSARDLFTYAKDLDALRFRAPSGINRIIETHTGTGSNYFVPVRKQLQDSSQAGIIGNEVMLEHLHPNQAGYFLIGKSFARGLLKRDIPGYRGAQDTTQLSSWRDYYHKMYLSSFDQWIAYHRIRTLKSGWPYSEVRRKEEYMRNYEFKSKADSLAFRHVHYNKNWIYCKVELGQYYEKIGRLDKSYLEFMGLIRNNPGNVSAHKSAAKVALKQNDRSKARPHLEKAYKLNKDPFAAKMLGAFEVQRGNLEEGIELLKAALAQKPRDVQALYNLSGAYAQNGNLKRAEETLDEALSINPDFPGLRQWQRQLQRHRQ